MIKIIIIGITALLSIILKAPAAFRLIKNYITRRKYDKITKRVKELEIEKQQDESKKRLKEQAETISTSDIRKHFGSSKF